MLATITSPGVRGFSTSDRWPSCRLPMVGTKAARRWPPRQSRSSGMVLAICMRVSLPGVEAVVREGAALDGLHIGPQGAFDAVRTGHEIAHEPRRLAEVDAQHVVQHQHLP